MSSQGSNLLTEFCPECIIYGVQEINKGVSMGDKTFILRVVMQSEDVDYFFSFLNAVKYEATLAKSTLLFRTSYWEGFFLSALELSTSQPIYRKQGRS